MEVREKLIALLDDIQVCGEDFTDYEIYGMRLPNTVSNEDVADALIANGVTIPVRCKECKHWFAEDPERCKKMRASPYGWCCRTRSIYVEKPVVPGHDDLYNVSETAFHNGERYMKDKIINLLMEHKTQVKGVCHAHVVEIIKMVEGL